MTIKAKLAKLIDIYIDNEETTELIVHDVLHFIRTKNINELHELDRPQAINTTEQPSAAAAVEGILTEEELKGRNRLLVLENDDLLAENTKLKNSLKAIATASTNLADSLKIQANLTLEALE